jgi:hypothetical protein
MSHTAIATPTLFPVVEAAPSPQPERKKLKIRKRGVNQQCAHCGKEEFTVVRHNDDSLTLTCIQCATAEHYSLVYGQQPVRTRVGYGDDIPSIFKRAE